MLTARAVEILREERNRLLGAVKAIDGLLEIADRAPSDKDGRIRHDVATGNSRGRQAKYDWELGRKLYEIEGLEMKAIADRVGSSLSAVKSQKKARGWRRKTQRKKNTTSERPTVLCPKCEKDTAEGPCEHCHRPLPDWEAEKLAKLQLELT